MKALPYEIKQKLRQVARNSIRGKELGRELMELFEKHGFDTECVDRVSGISYVKPNNEALAYIENGEGGTEESIQMIEEVLLHIVNVERGGRQRKPWD